MKDWFSSFFQKLCLLHKKREGFKMKLRFQEDDDEDFPDEDSDDDEGSDDE